MLVALTDFSEPQVWLNIKSRIAQPSPEGFLADVEYIESEELGLLGSADSSRSMVGDYPESYQHPAVILVDAVSLSSDSNPVLVVSLRRSDGYMAFRALPEAAHSIENNLSGGNMDFREFVVQANIDGVFKGFL